MHDLEEQLVAVHPLVGALLEGEQLLGVEVPLVVARRRRPAGSACRNPRRRPDIAVSILRRVSDLFSDAAPSAPTPSRRFRSGSGRDRWTSSSVRRRARPGHRAAPGDRGGPRAVDDPPRPARGGEDDDRADRGRGVVGDLRGALGRVRPRGRRTRGARPRARPARRERAADAPLHRRDPPVRQATAGLRAARRRGGARDADRRDDREPVLRGQPGAPLTLHRDRARAADGGGARRSCSPAAPRSLARTSRRSVAAESHGGPGGDARTALQTLELAWETARASGAALTVELVDDVARKRPLRYDRAGDQHYDLVSAFIKSMRGSDPDAAVYYLAAMLEGGEDPRFLARRIVIAASEDVGNADPQALVVAVAAAQALEHVGLPEAQLNLAQAAIYVARAPKSNASARAIWDARADVRRDGIAAAARDASRRPLPRGGRPADTASGTSPPTTTRARGAGRPSPREPARTRVLCPLRQRRGGWQWRSRRVTGRRISISRRRPTARACGSPTTAAARTSCSSSTLSRSRPSAPRRRRTSRRTSPPSATRTPRSCSSPATRPRRARPGRQELGAEYTFASDFWSHGTAAKDYGVFNEETGAPHPRHVPDRPRRRRDLVARGRPRQAPDGDGARLARHAPRRRVSRPPASRSRHEAGTDASRGSGLP